MADYAETKYGFRFGAATVERAVSDERHGVWLTIRTPRETMEVRVTNTGLIRVQGPRRSHA